MDKEAARRRYDELVAKKADLDRQLAAVREPRDKLRDELAEKQATLRELNAKVKEAEAAVGYFENDMAIAQAARDAGAKSIKAGGLGAPSS